MVKSRPPKKKSTTPPPPMHEHVRHRIFKPVSTPFVIDEKAFLGTLTRDDAKKDLLGRERVIGLKNADSSEGINPKDKIGASKVDFTVCPSSAYIAWALAQMDGVTKYGPYNWRVEPVQMRTYLAAIMRHTQEVLESEDVAHDSLILSLGHVMACAAILIDAQACKTLVDDRPIPITMSTISKANEFIKQKPKGWGR